VITGHVPRKNSPMSVLLFYRLDGAYCRVSDDETAFSGGRTPRYGVSSPDRLCHRMMPRPAPCRTQPRLDLMARAPPSRPAIPPASCPAPEIRICVVFAIMPGESRAVPTARHSH